jgi:hypothetical protein
MGKKEKRRMFCCECGIEIVNPTRRDGFPMVCGDCGILLYKKSMAKNKRKQYHSAKDYADGVMRLLNTKTPLEILED